MRELPGQEAEMLSVYFEELAAYQAKQTKKAQSNNETTRNGASEELTEWELKDDDWDSDDWTNLLHDGQLQELYG